jgi:5-methylcytosine-specific restriction enzyme A
MRVSTKIRHVVRKRAHNKCEICRSGVMFQVHHRRPRGMGGSTDTDTNLPANLLYLCGDCHLVMVEVNRSTALDNGWLVPQTMSPTLVPVKLGAGWYYLDNHGGVSRAPAGGRGRLGRGDSG